VHRGETYVVDELDVEDACAVVHADSPEWTTVARDVTDLRIVAVDRSRPLGTVTAHTGVVDVTNQVVAYQRRRAGTGEVLAEFPLDLPARQLRTRAVWLTLDDTAVRRADVDDAALPGSLHAAEHASIGILPLLATCDRWDLGGVSTALHPDTGAATIVVYDGHPGGAGFAERGFRELRSWLTATRATVASCECESGCPSCVQSPKCGNGNDPLDKAGAVRVLDVVLDELAAAGERADLDEDGTPADAGAPAPAPADDGAGRPRTPARRPGGGGGPRPGRVRVGRAAQPDRGEPAEVPAVGGSRGTDRPGTADVPAEDDLVF
jgi:DEAD/DEAH box helicase domain-containing protein